MKRKMQDRYSLREAAGLCFVHAAGDEGMIVEVAGLPPSRGRGARILAIVEHWNHRAYRVKFIGWMRTRDATKLEPLQTVPIKMRGVACGLNEKDGPL